MPPAHYNPLPKFGLRIAIGLLDLTTNTWIGDDQGPMCYTNVAIAMVAHAVLSYRLGLKGTELIPAMLPPGAYHRRPDDFQPVMTPEDSWAVAEGEMSEHVARRNFKVNRVRQV